MAASYILWAFLSVAFGENVPVITTPLGKVSGVYETSYEGRSFASFYGVPYAKPPIGELRFEDITSESYEVMAASYILWAFLSVAFGENVPVITTPLGKVSGVYETSYEGRSFASFYGVPYAKPPIGELRFEEPQPISKWEGTWNATTSGIICAQVTHVSVPEGGLYSGNEDCLYLNIFVPRKNPAEGRPLNVIAYIHGGAFMFGSNNVGPHFIMDRDVLLVSINYRLGTLGFLSTEDGILPSNIGFKDQVLALQWIKENIRSFGGNPDSVTLTGLSAGGASVHFHYFSPLSKGIFHRGISISGTVFGPTKFQENALEKTKKIGLHLGCTQEDSKLLKRCMKTRSTRQVVEAIKVLRPWLYYPYSPIAATVERSGENIFLPDHPWALLSRKEFNDVPWINSITSDEGLYPGLEFITNPKHLQDLEERWLELAPHLLDYNFTVPKEKLDEVSQLIKKEYLGGKKISEETFKDFIAILSDRLFVLCAEKASKMQAHHATSDIYNYFFSFPGEGVKGVAADIFGKHESYGVCHGDDTAYIFSNAKNPASRLTKAEERIKDVFLDAWASFADSRKPSVANVNWKPVTKELKEPLEHLHIKNPDEIFMEDANVVDRHREFWDNLPIMEDDNLYLEVYRHVEL